LLVLAEAWCENSNTSHDGSDSANAVFIALGGASIWFVIGVSWFFRQQRTS
jgi:hypothetical protein